MKSSSPKSTLPKASSVQPPVTCASQASVRDIYINENTIYKKIRKPTSTVPELNSLSIDTEDMPLHNQISLSASWRQGSNHSIIQRMSSLDILKKPKLVLDIQSRTAIPVEPPPVTATRICRVAAPPLANFVGGRIFDLTYVEFMVMDELPRQSN